MAQPNTVNVTILDKSYQVACPPEQKADLVTSANYLDSQMRSIRDTGKVIGLERIAVMAALNISYELLRATRTDGETALASTENADSEAAFRSLNNKLEEALHKLRQIEIS
ncbi:cell division protein ZapA [Chromatocurvus halotolerans]|uniref:Cell division protein ZapA n=1 Tax=Chromatocurvus halotolerans TaxID=1132028 RepID=A0A4R2KVU6_9GAMM|nr:cell division protein ZapA [Chromatocurvus halotolerans]TCO75339.1 cell division protein ZapA [Chromatocurvus halotolerans]